MSVVHCMRQNAAMHMLMGRTTTRTIELVVDFWSWGAECCTAHPS